ncbi:MAG: UDP-N-acetylglucosamine 2-epimerase (non-hydrolyzing) [Pirellulales bacterium]|nr:UDP-N-acetylglucosamine 2-epimerase (non-hydrolyzing) [Pirellulales bacterium]
MSRLRPLLTFGTRPEGIKLAPVVQACRRADEIEPIVCLTGQHREMLDQVVQYFDLPVDRDLKLMQPNQTLAGLTSRCIEGIDSLLAEYKPHCLVIQGDTTTVMAAAVAAFYRRVPVVHVEAGLRTGNMQAPWPEEFNRRVASVVASLHCAPTKRAADHLRSEGADSASVHVTGNTVVDALLWTMERERANSAHWQDKYGFLGNRRMVLVTGHRRENFGEGFASICHAIADLAARFLDIAFVYPVHLNPNVREPVHNLLGGIANVHLIAPAPYPEFVWLMDRSTLILSDSGGVQEEAPSLRKPVLVMRTTTERPEAVEAGAVELVGTCRERIVDRVSRLLTDPREYAIRQIDQNPYGDGNSAQRIVDLMLNQGWQA